MCHHVVSFLSTRFLDISVSLYLSTFEQGALPAFALPPTNRMFGDPNPILSFDEHTKFFLLRRVANDLVASFGQVGIHLTSAHTRALHHKGEKDDKGLTRALNMPCTSDPHFLPLAVWPDGHDESRPESAE